MNTGFSSVLISMSKNQESVTSFVVGIQRPFGYVARNDVSFSFVDGIQRLYKFYMSEIIEMGNILRIQMKVLGLALELSLKLFLRQEF